MEREWKELYLIPLGIAAVVEEKVRKISDTLVDKGKHKEKELKKRLAELKEKSIFATLEKKSSSVIERLLKELDIPKGRELREIKREIEEIKQLLRERS